jgi:hypothetical protein
MTVYHKIKSQDVGRPFLSKKSITSFLTHYGAPVKVHDKIGNGRKDNILSHAYFIVKFLLKTNYLGI